MSVEDRRDLDVRRFRLDTTVTIAHILTTMALLFKLFEWGGSVETRLTANSIELEAIKHARAETAKQVNSSLTEIKTDVKSLNTKIDQMILTDRNRR